jgi:hypothetical protein
MSRSMLTFCRKLSALHAVLVALGVALCVALLPYSGAAVQPQLADRDEAITYFERLGGAVGIDGEQPGQPVWMVDLTETNLDAETLDRLRALPDVEKLLLDRTPLTDDMLDHIVPLRKLAELSLADTQITDAGMRRLAQFPHLERLNLSGTKVTDDGLQQLAPLKKLTDLLTFDTPITTEGLRRLAESQKRSQAPVPEVPETGIEPRPVDSQREASPGTLARTELAGTLHELGRALFPAALRHPDRQRQAVELLEQAVLRHPENELYRLDLADAYLELGTDETVTLALGLYETSDALRSEDEAVLSRIAEAYGRLKNFDAAIAVAALRLSGGAKSPFPAALQMAALATESGDMTRGIAELQAAVQSHPEDAGIKLLLAALLFEAGHTQRANAEIDAALALLPPGHPLIQAARRLQDREGS